MKNEPLVSIIMNCFNGERYLNESLKSILDQSYQNWELIFGIIYLKIVVKKSLIDIKIKDLNILLLVNIHHFM